MPFFKRNLFIIIPLTLMIISGFIYIFTPPREEPKRIGVLFYQNNPTTASFLNGLIAGLAKQGYYQGKNLNLFVKNMQNASQRTTSIILKNIERRKVHLLVTTGKDLTIATAHTIPDKPIIYSLVSRPITDETIKTVIEKESNITGVSYFTPYDRTLELGKRVIPRFEKLALLLPIDSAWPDFDRLKEAADKLGIELTIIKIPLTKITTTISKLSGRTDAVYLPYDINLMFLNNSIKNALLSAKIPAISNNLEYQSSCVLTYFAEPETIGEIASRMAVKIFHKAKIKFLPVELSSYFKLTINQSLLTKFDFRINEDVLSYANEII